MHCVRSVSPTPFREYRLRFLQLPFTPTAKFFSAPAFPNSYQILSKPKSSNSSRSCKLIHQLQRFERTFQDQLGGTFPSFSRVVPEITCSAGWWTAIRRWRKRAEVGRGVSGDIKIYSVLPESPVQSYTYHAFGQAAYCWSLPR